MPHLLLAWLASGSAQAQQSATPEGNSPQPNASDAAALARAVQNPVADMISLPFQNNTNFNYGPRNHAQNVLNVQPVIPISLNEHWNLITRTIVPVLWQPGLSPGEGTTFGLGATQVSALLSPARPVHGVILGAGAIVQLPTTTDPALGSTIWGAGPTAVALTMQGPWVVGGLINNVWSFGGSRDDRYNILTIQPFINYNFPHLPGTYLSFSPIINANWEAKSGQRWTVPLGLAVGQIFHLGHQPVNGQIGAYYNVVRPDIGPEWQLRAQLTFLFPS